MEQEIIHDSTETFFHLTINDTEEQFQNSKKCTTVDTNEHTTVDTTVDTNEPTTVDTTVDTNEPTTVDTTVDTNEHTRVIEEQKSMIDDENNIVDQKVATSTLPDTTSDSYTESDSDDNMSKMYLIIINNETRFVVNTKSKAVAFVEDMAKELLEYYSYDNSVYKVFLTRKNDVYSICGYYRFMTVQCETLFDTLKIVEIEKLD